jgi:hypothetical protein
MACRRSTLRREQRLNVRTIRPPVPIKVGGRWFALTSDRKRKCEIGTVNLSRFRSAGSVDGQRWG